MFNKISLDNCRIFVKDIQVAYSHLKESVEDHGQESESLLTRENVEKKSSPVTIMKSEEQDYSNDNMSLDVKLYQAQVRVVFGLQVLGSLTVSQPPATNVSCCLWFILSQCISRCMTSTINIFCHTVTC